MRPNSRRWSTPSPPRPNRKTPTRTRGPAAAARETPPGAGLATPRPPPPPGGGGRAAPDESENADPDAEPDDVLREDAAPLWHPYAKTHPPARVWEAVRTAGTRITLRDGRELVDGMSSWWSAIHGYNHPALQAALREQIATMPHVMFGGLTHSPATTLARRLVDIAPRGLGRVFFADSGSVAMEVALKMAIQYQHATGHPEKRRFLTPRGGYHGDTIGAMSV
ncbi:MAG: aminotransferase class III-fold pyridoxal phosphate-dependent enzyme, partial [Planctomycetes bacterium]|nr:aminotransferase class III-fold pyridoxal phosphate-dependent enzyme [Planctomycetota bacterium]